MSIFGDRRPRIDPIQGPAFLEENHTMVEWKFNSYGLDARFDPILWLVLYFWSKHIMADEGKWLNSYGMGLILGWPQLGAGIFTSLNIRVSKI